MVAKTILLILSEKVSLAHFPPSLKLSVNLTEVTLFYFKLKFGGKINGATLAYVFDKK